MLTNFTTMIAVIGEIFIKIVSASRQNDSFSPKVDFDRLTNKHQCETLKTFLAWTNQLSVMRIEYRIL